MKNLLLPILAILLFSACQKESLESPVPTTESEMATVSLTDFSTSSDLAQQTPYLQSYFKELAENSHYDNKSGKSKNNLSRRGRGKKEPVYVAVNSNSTGEIAGHCTINRNSAGAHISFHTNSLVPGELYQIWAAVINYDENCNPIFFPVFQAFDSITLGEKTANPAGKLNLTLFLDNGDGSNSWPPPFGSGVGMLNSMQADLILFARNSEGEDVRLSEHFIGCN